MAVRIGINGFGRIGRNVLRIALGRPGIEVVALNHKSRRLPADDKFAGTLAHLLKYDTIHGKLDNDVQGAGNNIQVDGREIKVLAVKDPADLPWGELGVDIVVESTGKFNAPEGAALHLKAGAKRVVLSAPAKGNAFTAVMGVNHTDYDPAVHRVVSNASCTTNCLAPVAKVIWEKFGLIKGLMTTIHAVTNDQQILDMPHRDMRRARSGVNNIIPTTTGAARAVALVLPQLQGRLNGFSMRVPVTNVSVVDLVAQVGRKVTGEEINAALKEAAENELKGIMAYSELPLVSSDYNGDTHSSIVDALSTMAIGDDMIKVVAWYDNEWGYSNRIIDLVEYMAARGL
ncbi:MAG: glyceraldehyde-3-phosphate dehydrogenase [Peptococcaceae bacterium BRH_c4a]|nr:MAG: glyceraldehyde-3-phosphate dehydrogenase [Peptococcaceae bacterium BRH_c4a]